MTKEEKQLLLKDICPRFPYKVKVHVRWMYQETDGKLKYKEEDRVFEINDLYSIWDVKPYLRTMSSMTIEEYKEYDSHRSHICDEYNRYCFDSIESIDWLNANHFDYRGLIDKGLALEAPEGMYKS